MTDTSDDRHRQRYENLRAALGISVPTAEEVVGAAIAFIEKHRAVCPSAHAKWCDAAHPHHCKREGTGASHEMHECACGFRWID